MGQVINLSIFTPLESPVHGRSFSKVDAQGIKAHANFFVRKFLTFLTGFTVSILVMSSILYASTSLNTIEDIKEKTGYQTPLHSERANAVISTVTPSELLAYLDKYNKDIIKMQVLFNNVTKQGLNKWVPIDGTKHKWSSANYISFKIKDPKQKHICTDIYLFINKTNPDADILLRLTKETPIFITGRIKNTANGKAWIDVIKIENI